METSTVNKLSYHELDALVNEHFPKSNYQFIANEEANNDNVYEFSNIRKDDLLDEIIPPTREKYTEFYGVYEYHLQEFMEFISGKKYQAYMTQRLLEYFVYLGILPEGNYLIDVSW